MNASTSRACAGVQYAEKLVATERNDRLRRCRRPWDPQDWAVVEVIDTDEICSRCWGDREKVPPEKINIIPKTKDTYFVVTIVGIALILYG